jgi:hypothetical protein
LYIKEGRMTGMLKKQIGKLENKVKKQKKKGGTEHQ